MTVALLLVLNHEHKHSAEQLTPKQTDAWCYQLRQVVSQPVAHSVESKGTSLSFGRLVQLTSGMHTVCKPGAGSKGSDPAGCLAMFSRVAAAKFCLESLIMFAAVSSLSELASVGGKGSASCTGKLPHGQ